MSMTVKTNQEIEKLSIVDKMIMRDARENNLWYVEFIPTPEGIKETFVSWVVRKFTPEWSLISASKTVETPYSKEEIGEALLGRIETYRATFNSPPPDNVMILKFTAPEKE